MFVAALLILVSGSLLGLLVGPWPDNLSSLFVLLVSVFGLMKRRTAFYVEQDDQAVRVSVLWMREEMVLGPTSELSHGVVPRLRTGRRSLALLPIASGYDLFGPCPECEAFLQALEQRTLALRA